MPSTPNFSSWRHLLGVLIRSHNPQVNEFFDKLRADDARNNEGKKSASISAIRTACLIRADDSAPIASNKQQLFLSHLQLLGGNSASSGNFYAIPIETFHERVQFKPQVVMLFRQIGVKRGDPRAIEAQIGFRWRKENPRESDAESLAHRIDGVFGDKKDPYKWRKGATICSYYDPPNGYELRIYADGEDEGKNVIEQVLKIQNGDFDPDRFSYSQTTRRLRTGRESKVILGESRRLPRERPEGDVSFRRAELKIWGVRPDVVLVDYTGRHSDLLG